MISYFRNKIKNLDILDIGYIKIVCILIGAILGAYISEFVKDNLLVFITISAIFYCHLLIRIFKK